MKVWVFEIGEPLPLETDVRLHRYGQFTQFLAEQGHQVTWWTSTFSHAPKKNFAEKDEDIILGRVNLKLMYSSGYARNISFARIKHNRLMARKFTAWAASCEKPDLMIAPIPTIETCEAAVDYAVKNGIPVLLDIRDHWPDELRDLFPKTFRPLARFALNSSYRKMRFVCQNATGVMGVSRETINYGLKFTQRDESSNDYLFPLGYSTKSISCEKLRDALDWCQKTGLDRSAFICCFFGTIGQYFDLSTVIEAARRLESKFNIQFLLAGDGANLQKYKKQAEGCKSVVFPGWIDAPKIAAVMSMSKVGLAPYGKETAMSLPNKPFEYMAGGLPIVSSIQKELKDLLAEHKIGFTYSADSVEQLCEALVYLYQNEEERQEMGVRSRQLLEDRFETKSIFNGVMKHFDMVVSSTKRTS